MGEQRPEVMNANVLKSKSLFCLDASYAPLRIHTEIRRATCRGDGAPVRVKGLKGGRRCYFLSCLLTQVSPRFARLFAHPVVLAVSSLSAFFLSNLSAALTVTSARQRVACTFCPRKAKRATVAWIQSFSFKYAEMSKRAHGLRAETLENVDTPNITDKMRFNCHRDYFTVHDGWIATSHSCHFYSHVILYTLLFCHFETFSSNPLPCFLKLNFF